MRISTDAKRKILALFLGSVFALSLLELTIRGIGYFDRGARSSALAGCRLDLSRLDRKNRILVLGNSFTAGAGAPPGHSYSDYLQAILDRKYPGQFSVFNCGVVLATTRYVLDHLEENLAYKPTLVIVMNGQANHLNNYGLAEYIRESGHFPDSDAASKRSGAFDGSLRHLSSFRLVEVLQNQMASEISKESQGLLFLEKEEDTDAERCSPRKIEILKKLHKMHPDWRRACDLLARCSFQEGNGAETLEWIEKSLAIEAENFHFTAYRSLLEWKTALEGSSGARFGRALKKARATYPGDEHFAKLENWLIRTDAVTEPVQRRALLEEAIKAEPSFVYSYLAQTNPIHAERIETLKRGLVATLLPFRISSLEISGARMSIAREMRSVAKASEDKTSPAETERYLKNFASLYPHVGFAITSLEDDLVTSWVLFDLKKLCARLRSLGIPVLLQTFPPRRAMDKPQLVDSAIRKAAESEHVPLSDTYAELAKEFGRSGSKEEYYPPDKWEEHLNAKGYALVAEILYRSLSENGLIHRLD